MGLLTAFVVADVAQAARVGAATRPVESFGGWASKWLHALELEALWDAIDPTHDRREVALGPLLNARREDGPWVTEVNPALITRLAALDDVDLPRLAERGAEQLQDANGNDYTAGDIAVVLRRLREVAQRARSDGRALLHWASL